MNLRNAGLAALGIFVFGTVAFLIGSSQEGRVVIVNESGTPIQTPTSTREPYRTPTPVATPTPQESAHTWYAPGVNPHNPGAACSVSIYGKNVNVFGLNNNPDPDEGELVSEGYTNIVMPAGEGWRYIVDGSRETMECLKQISGIDKEGNRTYGGVFGYAETEEQPMNIAPIKQHERDLARKLDGILIGKGENQIDMGVETE